MKRQGGLGIRRWLVVDILMLAIAGSALGGPTAASAAGFQHARIWATIASTRPGIGCSVAVNVEVRTDGEPVPGLAVEVAFLGDGSNPTSTDEAVTGDDGIASLAFDTGGATDGADGWLDIDVAGAYVVGTSVLPRAGADCSDGGTELSAETDIPDQGAAVSDDGTVATSGDAVIIAGVPAYKQSRSLSCEYASVYIATSVFGNPIPEEDYLGSTPQSDNPHDGFRGDIDGPWGTTDDYGIYAEALVPNLEEHGYVGDVAYQPDAGYVRSQIDANHPTLVWIATRGDTGFYEQDAAGNSFKLVPYEHVVVAYGYDDGGVYVSDPGNASYEYFSWSWFLDAWSVMDGMSLAVYPA